jgi:RNA polymerase sigma-70 factor (ECF subfamily)
LPGGNEHASTFIAYRTALIRLATPIVGCRAYAEDIVQKAFIRVTEHAHKNAAVRHPVAFIFQVVRNLFWTGPGARRWRLDTTRERTPLHP